MSSNPSNPLVRRIRRAANIGFYGCLLLVALAVAEHFLGERLLGGRFVVSDYTARLMLVSGTLFAVVDIALILLTHRRQTPRLRQLDSVDERLGRYATLMAQAYYTSLAVTLVLSFFIVVSHENTLLMLLLLMLVMLMLNYPNMYKIKADLGLNDEQMTDLFGDQYVK